MLKTCPGYKSDGSGGEAYEQARHDLENTSANFGPGKSQCRTCYGVYARDWRAKRNVGGAATPRRISSARRPTIVLPDFRAPAMEPTDGDTVSDEDMKSGSHEYKPIPGLLETWGAVTSAAAKGEQAETMMFLGPSGCGKTEGAEWLAMLVGLPFTKIDAASMTDAESWFGTREVISDPDTGSSITTYKPSAFVLAVEQPGVLLIDEVNRAKDSDRNVLIPLIDHTHQVTNPLTGDIVRKNPRCFIIMSGNRGLNFTGTYAIDPAFMKRTLHVTFDYVDQAAEIEIAREATNCDEQVAALFVRFANETRERSKTEPDFDPMSTREVILACRMVVNGASLDNAAKSVVIAGASPEGGASSAQFILDGLWTGLRAQNTAGVTTRKCGIKHPYASVGISGDPVTCVIDVPLSTLAGVNGHPASPQHHGEVDSDGDSISWFDQP